MGGGFTKAISANLNLTSYVMSDLNISNRKGVEGKHKYVSDKTTQGIGGAYYGGVNYKRITENGISKNEISLAVLGFGGQIEMNDQGEINDWFVGFDPSLNMKFGFGLELNFKIGFSK